MASDKNRPTLVRINPQLIHMKNPKVIIAVFAVGIVLLLIITGLTRPESDARETLGVIGLLVLAGLFYFLPAIIAHRADHPNAPAITVLNLFGGWTVIGWIAAIVWAYYKPSAR